MKSVSGCHPSGEGYSADVCCEDGLHTIAGSASGRGACFVCGFQLCDRNRSSSRSTCRAALCRVSARWHRAEQVSASLLRQLNGRPQNQHGKAHIPFACRWKMWFPLCTVICRVRPIL